MSDETSGKNLDEIFGQYSKTKDYVQRVLAALARGVSEFWQQPFKNLKNRLISLIAALLLVFNPWWGENLFGFVFKLFFKKSLNQTEWFQRFEAWWPYLFGGAVLLALVLMVWEQLTRKPLPPVPFRNPAIKGLLSFEQADAEIFKKLQREVDVQQILAALTHQSFHFGVLTGVSGCGKSSLLKAGLLPALAEREQRAAIVTLTDEPPLESVRKALAGQLGATAAPDADLTALANGAANGNLLLIFDQFEQFFTQNRTEESREPFLLELWNTYQNAPNVKILLSIRLDFMGRLHEIQQRLQYSLNADQNYFNLRKFKPEQAVRIFQVMSDLGNLDAFDQGFMLRMTREELASKEDGLVTAADVQLVGTALQQSDSPAFDENTFRQNGGVQGMVQQYLQKLLETPNYFNLRQEALKILLAFVDLDNNTRKGRLSAADLRSALGDAIPPDFLTANLEWLAQNRLLHRPGDQQAAVWELAHERLIEPLRALGNKTLGPLERDNLLLNRRVNEWLANHQKDRFLLTRREYFDFRKNADYLVIEPNKAAKKDLMERSGKRVRFWNRAAAAVLVLLVAAWGVYETAWYKVEVLAKGEVEDLILDMHAGKGGGAFGFEAVGILDSLSEVNPRQALGIASKLGLAEKKQAYEAIWPEIRKNILEDSLIRKQIAEWLIPYLPDTVFLSTADSLLVLVVESVNKERRKVIIGQLKAITEKIVDKLRRAKNFGSLAESADNRSAALAFLEQGRKSAESIKDDDERAQSFHFLAESAIKVGDHLVALAFLEQGRKSAENIKIDDEKRAWAFHLLAESAIKVDNHSTVLAFLEQSRKSAEKIREDRIIAGYGRANVFRSLAESVVKVDDHSAALAFLEQLRKSAESIKDEHPRARVFRSLAEPAVKVSDHLAGLAFLEQLRKNAENFEYQLYRAEVLQSLTESVAKVDDHSAALAFLEQLRKSAESIPDESSRAGVFQSLAESAGKLGNPSKAFDFLEQLRKIAEKITDQSERARVFTSLAETAVKLGDPSKALTFLEQGRKSVESIKDESSSYWIFWSLAQLAGKLGDPSKARTFLEQLRKNAESIQDESSRAGVFQSLAESASKLNDPEATKTFLSQLEQYTTGFEPKSQALAAHLRGLSQAWATLGHFRKAYDYADQIEDKYPEKVFALIHLQKCYREQKGRKGR